jgi:YaiO family outer membrane protein
MSENSGFVFFNFRSCIPLVFIIVLIPLFSLAQEDLTVDEQYKKARQIAFEEDNYDKARKIAYRALDRSPDYHGIRIFIARLFAWEGNYPRAREELLHVLDNDFDNRRALLAIIEVESWSGHHKKAFEWAQKALEYHPREEELMLAKASALAEMGNYSDAKRTYRNILDVQPSRKAREALKSLQLKQMKYSATLSYRHDRFSDIFDPWDFGEIQLSRQTKYGSLIGRVQYANRFATDGVQFNLDAYPSLFKGMYAYISGGYSEASIYPRYRFGLSLYKSLPAAFEIEGGIRYLEFSTSKVNIYTFSLSKYWGNYLLTARSFLVPSAAGSSQSFSLSMRHYFGDARTYLEMSGGFGSASSDIQFAEDIRRLDSWSVRIAGQRPISERLNIGGNAGYDSEVFVNFDRKKYSFKIFLSFHF